MNNLIIIILLLPILYYIPVFFDRDLQKRQINLLIPVTFVLLTTVAVLVLYFGNANEGVFYTKLILFDSNSINNILLPLSLYIDKTSIIFFILSMFFLIIPAIINKAVKKGNNRNRYLEYNIVGLILPIVFVFFASNYLMLFFAFIIFSITELLIGISLNNKTLQKLYIYNFILHRLIDTLIFITILYLFYKTPVQPIWENGYGHINNTSGNVLIIGFLAKTFLIFIVNLLYTSKKTIEETYSLLNISLFIMSYLFCRFQILTRRALVIQVIVVIFFTIMIVSYSLSLLKENKTKEIVKKVTILLGLLLTTIFLTGPSRVGFYFLFCSVLISSGLYLYYSFCLDHLNQSEIKGLIVFHDKGWCRYYLITTLLVLVMFPGTFMFWALNELLWKIKEIHSLGGICFVNVLLAQAALVWAFMKMVVKQMLLNDQKSLKSSGKETIPFKVSISFYLIFVIVLSLVHLPDKFLFIKEHILINLITDQSLFVSPVKQMNIWFMLIWSLFFCLELVAVYYLYILKKERFNLDSTLNKLLKTIERLFIFVPILARKIESLGKSILIKNQYLQKKLVEQCFQKMLYEDTFNFIRKTTKWVGFFETRTIWGELNYYIWILFFLLITIATKMEF